MKLLVTGATGFLGSHLLNFLKQSKYEIYALTRSKQKDNEVNWITGDMHDYDFIRSLMMELKPNILVHLAWYVDPRDYINSKKNYCFLNSSQHLFETFLEAGGKNILCTGTCFEYDLNYGLLREDFTPLANNNVYASCKNMLNLYLQTLTKSYEFDYTWARMFYLYGPNESGVRLVPTIINSILSGEIAKCSVGTQLRDYMYIKDAARLLLNLVESPLNSSVNISTGYPVTIKKIGNTIEHLMKVTNFIDYGAFKQREGEPHLIQGLPLNHKLSTVEVKLTPLTEGLRETIDWWKNYDMSGM